MEENKPKDDVNFEPVKSEDIKIEEPPQPKSWLHRSIIPVSLAVVGCIALGVYLLGISKSDKLIAEALEFTIANDSATTIISVTNRMNDQAMVNRIFPVYYGKGQSASYAKAIDAGIEGASLPLIIYPNEMRIIKLKFQVDKKDLTMYGDTLKDSTHVLLYRDNPLKGQLAGTLGLGWDVNDSDGKSFANNARLAYYVTAPSPEGLKELKSLTRCGLLTEESFELCLQAEPAGNKDDDANRER